MNTCLNLPLNIVDVVTICYLERKSQGLNESYSLLFCPKLGKIPPTCQSVGFLMSMRHKFKISSLYKQSLLNSLSDKLLVHKAKRDDKEAFGKLYLNHLDSIYRYIFFRVNQEREQAEDLTEIVFFKAWEKLDNFDEDGVGFRAWIYKIAHNLVIDHYRDNKKRVELNDSIPDESQNVEEKVLKDLESKNLLKAIEQLSEEQREVITMKFIEGLSNKEISKVLNKHEDAIRALQYRALKVLKQILG